VDGYSCGDSKPLKRKLFNNGRLNIFAFSKKKRGLDESMDSGVEMSHTWNSSQSSIGSNNDSPHCLPQNDLLVGGAGKENFKAVAVENTTNVETTDSLLNSPVKSVSADSRKNREYHQYNKTKLLPVPSPEPTSAINIKDKEEENQQDDTDGKEDISRILLKSLKDRLPVKKLVGGPDSFLGESRFV